MYLITIYGKKISYPRYCIPSINYNNKLLFTIYDNKFMKFILTDISGNIIQSKFIKALYQ